MAKRKLTRRQAWRVNKIQQERIARAEKRDDALSDRLEGGELGPEQQGLVVAHYGVQVDVEGREQELQRCHLRANVESLVAGDRVVWRPGDPTGVVEARLDRESSLLRPTAAGLRTVAANVNLMAIVFALRPQAHAGLIDRYLVAASACGIRPLLVLNKTDLLPPGDSEVTDMVTLYRSLGYELCFASTVDANGLDQLRTALTDHTVVFVGQSGVGKSSLVNALIPGVEQAVSELSAAREKGVHTTTTARLFHFPDGGRLIDSPGIREFNLWQLDRDEVAAGFLEFRPFLGHCKFRDCEHQSEPECAIIAALERGDITPQRLDSYRHIVGSLATG